MFKRILVPVDGTSGSEKAVPYAMGLAKALDCEVIVCHVITTPPGASSSAVTHDAAQYANKVAGRVAAAGLAVKTQVRAGDPPIEISKAAADFNVDAIVMATRGRQRFEKLMLGSVADALVRDSRLPVLLVSSRKQLKRVATDPARQPRNVRMQATAVRRVMLRLAVSEAGALQKDSGAG